MARWNVSARQNKKTRPCANPNAAASVAAASGVVRWLLPLLVVTLTLLVFLPSLRNDFVNWDDPANLLDNPDYRGLTLPHLRWMFTTFYVSLYRPLTWITYAVDYLIWGMNPFGYHLTNVLLHGLNAVLFYFVSLRLFKLSTTDQDFSDLTLKVAAGLAALFFSLHPLRVEVVAWVSARNDVLSAVFFLCTILFYLKYCVLPKNDASRRWWFTAALAAYILLLLAKASSVTLPLVLIVLDMYPLKRLPSVLRRWFQKDKRIVWQEKLFFLMPAVLGGMAAFAAKYQLGSMASVKEAGLSTRIAQSFYGLFFYPWKTLIPLDLSPLYELPLGLSPLDDEIIVSAIVVLALSIALIAGFRRWPAALAIWLYYILIVAPVLGIVQSGPQLAADRYSYLSCLGFALLPGGAFIHFSRLANAGRISSSTSKIFASLQILVLITLSGLSWKQVQIWYDSETLWRHALAVMPSAIPHYNLGVSLAAAGKLDEAIGHFRKTLELSPSYENADYNLARLLANRGDLDEATKHYRRAAELNPRDPEIYGGFALVLARQGRVREAIEMFRYALRLHPNDSSIHFNLARALAQQGQLDEAAEHFQIAVKIRPDFTEAYYNLGRLVAAQGYLDQAIEDFRIALRISPEYVEAHESLARALAEQGKRNEALEHFQEALRILKSRREAVSAP